MPGIGALPPRRADRYGAGPRYFWEAPHRPFFLAAATWALVAVGWWPLGVAWGMPAPGFRPAVLWHVHELIFGFIAVAMAGYILTALPNWAAHVPERGGILKLLLALWTLSRVAMANGDRMPPMLLPWLNTLFFGLLGALILQRTLSARAWSRVPFGAGVLALGLADMTFTRTALAGDVDSSLSLARSCLIGIALLVTLIGTRLIPAFTENWRLHRGFAPGEPPDGRLRQGAIALLTLSLGVSLMGWADPAHAAMIAAAVLLSVALSRWNGLSAARDPLVAGLHAAFLWMPIGLMLTGAVSVLPVPYAPGDAIHALTIGAFSGLILTISGRAACHRAGPVLRANGWLSLAMVLIWVATCLRLSAPLAAGTAGGVVNGAALIWCAAWAVFLVGFRPALYGPPSRPVLSGTKHGALTAR
ncbi:MAG: NnrS family protein [Ruegeria sp.]